MRRNIARTAALMPAGELPSLALVWPSVRTSGSPLRIALKWGGPRQSVAQARLTIESETWTLSPAQDYVDWTPLQGGPLAYTLALYTRDGAYWNIRNTMNIDQRPRVLQPWARSMLAGSLAQSQFSLSASGRVCLGADITEPTVSAWSLRDEAHFLYVPLVGDGAITAYQPRLSNDSGLMLRGDLHSDSQRVSLGWWNDQVLMAVRASRLERAKPLSFAAKDEEDSRQGHWWRLCHQGTRISAWHRRPQQDWRLLGTTELALPEQILVGVFGINQYDDLQQMPTAEFWNIAVANSQGVVLQEGPRPGPLKRRLRVFLPGRGFVQGWAGSGSPIPEAEAGMWAGLFLQDDHLLRGASHNAANG